MTGGLCGRWFDESTVPKPCGLYYRDGDNDNEVVCVNNNLQAQNQKFIEYWQ